MPIMPESTRASLPLAVLRSLLGWASFLPLASLLSRLSTPLGSTSSGGGSSSGVPAGGSGVSAPLAASGTGGRGLPVSTGAESASLDSGRANLVGGGELLLLDLLLGLSLRVAVCEVLVLWFLVGSQKQSAGCDIQK